MRVAIIENTAITHHGQVGVALHEAGALTDVCRPFADGALPFDATQHDALVVFGGEQTALDDALHPYLPRLAALMLAFGAADKPVLGICLGSQLLARAYGAANQIGTSPEFGWVAMQLTDAGKSDPVLSAAGSAFPVFQWHSDTFSLPEGATLLATNPATANQCFRVGTATYAVQFHFEANRAVVADWSRTFPDLAERMQPGWGDMHAARSAMDGSLADAAGLAIARAWVALIRDNRTPAL